MPQHQKVRFGYLPFLVIAVVVPAYFQYLWQYPFPQIPFIYGQAPGIWTGFLFTALALAFWSLDPWRVARPKLLRVFFVLLAILWAWEMLLTVVHGDPYVYGVWLYPLLIMMLFLKVPSRQEVRRSLLFAGWIFSALIIGTRILEIQGVMAEAAISSDLLEFEMENYWLPLSGWLGPDGRWVGPFFHNSQTGNVAAYLVVLGVVLRNRSSPVFILVGTLTLLLTSSRTSMVAAAVGAGVAVLIGQYRWNRRIAWPVRMGAAGALAAFAALVALWSSPNLTGRDVYWGYYWDLWRSSPWIGVGITGRGSGSPEFFDVNGHNLAIDALGTYGIVAAVLVVLILALSLTMAALSARSGEFIPIAVIITYSTIGLAQSDYNWTVVSVPWLMLLLPVLLASATLDSNVDTLRSPKEQPKRSVLNADEEEIG